MSVVDVKFYKCDICLEVFAKSGVLESITLPARQYDLDGKEYVIKPEGVDVCPNCFKKLFELIDSKFASIELGGGERHIYSYVSEEKK